MESVGEGSSKTHFSKDRSKNIAHSEQSLIFTNNSQPPNFAVSFPCKNNFHSFILPNTFVIQRFSHIKLFSSWETREIDDQGE